MKKQELISVIMSAYNEKEEWLCQSIESITGQTWKNIEFIIVDDAPDNGRLRDILSEYERRDSRIRVIYNKKNLGLALSMNLAWEQARGSYVARMDADDISMPDRLEKEVAYLEKHSLDMVTSNRIGISEQGEIEEYFGKLPGGACARRLLPYRNIVIHPSVLMRREIFGTVKGYRKFASAQDYDLWLRLLTSGYKIGVLDEPLIYYRVRENGISSMNYYKQFLFAKYARTLYRERKKRGGKDSFSEKNMKKYIGERYTEKKKERYDKASRRFSRGVREMKNKKAGKGIYLMVTSMMLSLNYTGEMFRLLVYEVRKRTA